jgi:molybdenum cofactor biosynthesis protein MoaF
MSARAWLAAALTAGVASAQSPPTQHWQESKQMTSLSGRTIRWTFVDGPTAGTTFEHTLDPDGSIVWRAVDGAYQGASRREKAYGAVRISDETWVVSYLAESGHTLTVVLNFADHRATGFASNDKTWHQLSGRFEVVN